MTASILRGISNKNTRRLVRHLMREHRVTVITSGSNHLKLVAPWMYGKFVSIGLTSASGQTRAVVGDLRRNGFEPCEECVSR